MKHLKLHIFILSCATLLMSCHQLEETTTVTRRSLRSQLVVGTMGASLMYDGNGWVEQACEQLNIECLNKAVSGETTKHFAQKLWKNEYVNDYELMTIDILLIQFANCKDVCGNDSILLPTAEDYTANYTEFSDKLFTEYNYAQQMDYILKKWYEMREAVNRPVHIIFVTHWHDGRETYNESVRRLAERWGADVCELDKNIGFTKDEPLPDGSQPSLLYAVDTETINGELFGWHPLRGEKGTYIQSVMAEILKEKLVEYIARNKVK